MQFCVVPDAGGMEAGRKTGGGRVSDGLPWEVVFHRRFFRDRDHLCTAICGQLMAGGVPCRYVQWRGDIPAIKAKVNDAEAYHEAIWPLKTVRALYIDDFLKGSVTEADKNIAFDLLNTRYANPDAITIISTEWPIDKILSWDEAIGSRIAERAREYTMNLRSKQNWRLREVAGG